MKKWKKYCTVNYKKCIEFNEFGQGVVVINNKKYYVDNMIPGEDAILEIFYEQNEYGKAKIIFLKNQSDKRSLDYQHPKLKYGTYSLAHLKDKFQDEYKMNQVKAVFKNNFVDNIKVLNRNNYRNKVVLHNGGFMAKNPRVTLSTEYFDLMDYDFSKFKDAKGDIIIRKLDDVIYGSPGDQKEVLHTSLGKKFIVNLNSFYQVNTEMSELAYKEIINNVGPTDIVFDLFSGAAVIGIHVSSKAKHIYSVEINDSSCKDALRNININDIKNISFIQSDVKTFLSKNTITPDVVIVDPSRKGLTNDSLKMINNLLAKKIIYLSCNIQTQSRDIKYLSNYRIARIQPFDFFPQTYHIENLVILEKK